MQMHTRRPCPEECAHCQKDERQAGSLKVNAADAADGWDCVALRKEQLTDHNVGRILQEV
jgi:hypothetical protein